MRTSRFWLLAVLLSGMLPAIGQTAPLASSGDAVRLLLLGDSLTAGYGLPASDAFSVQLDRALADRGHVVEIVNAGVSGDTTAGGLARLAWALADMPEDGPRAALVALGGNDGLRGLEPSETKANLKGIVDRLQKEGVAVLLAGMLAPPNLGRDYGAEFNSLFPAVAKESGILFYPFFLEGVAADPTLNQADGIHPNAEGVRDIVARMLPMIEELIHNAIRQQQK